MRFSLRTLIGIIAIIALCFWGWHGYRQLQRVRELEAVNEKLREELRKERGELKIEEANRDRLHAIAIPTIEPMTWRWRVYIPSGRTFLINSLAHEISDDNLPTSGAGCSINAGEQVLTVALRKNEATGNWNWLVRCGSGSCGPILDEQRSQWITSKPLRSSTQVIEQVSMPPGKPLEILRYRAFPDQVGPMTGPTEGILVWISEAKEAP